MDLISPPAIAVVGGPNEKESDQLVKSNILYIDGRNLYRSRMLDYHPLGRNEGTDTQAGEGQHTGNSSLLSRYVLEILVFLCRSDSRHYANRFGVTLQDYREHFLDYGVSQPSALYSYVGGLHIHCFTHSLVWCLCCRGL